jgi:hypothetical protein
MGWAAAGTIHRIECGGEDGELHIGAFNPNIIANNDEMPVSSSRNENDPGWGIVSEFPNALRGNGPMLFSQATGSCFTSGARSDSGGSDPTRDGRRFLVNTPVELTPIPSRVVLNWTPGLKK